MGYKQIKLLWKFRYSLWYGHNFSFFWDKCPGVLLLGCRGSLCSDSLINCQIISQNDHTILYTHLQYMTVPVSPYPHQHLVLSLFFLLALLADCMVISRYGLICISLKANGIKHLCHKVISHPHSLFGEMSLHVFCLFSDWIFSLFNAEF